MAVVTLAFPTLLPSEGEFGLLRVDLQKGEWVKDILRKDQVLLNCLAMGAAKEELELIPFTLRQVTSSAVAWNTPLGKWDAGNVSVTVM